jgi:DNA-binding transcriptional MerR regulator
MQNNLFLYLNGVKNKIENALPILDESDDLKNWLQHLFYKIFHDKSNSHLQRSENEYPFVLYYTYARLKENSNTTKRNCMRELSILLNRKQASVTSIFYTAYKKYNEGTLSETFDEITIEEIKDRPSEDFSTSKEVARKLNTSKHSIRKYAIILEKFGYIFVKFNGQRFYSQTDIHAIAEMKDHSGAESIAKLLVLNQKNYHGLPNEPEKEFDFLDALFHLFNINDSKLTSCLKVLMEKMIQKDEKIKELKKQLVELNKKITP